MVCLLGVVLTTFYFLLMQLLEFDESKTADSSQEESDAKSSKKDE